MRITEINKKNYETEVVNSRKPVILYFWAPWCQFCPKMTERFEKISVKFSNLAKFYKANVDDAPEIANKNNIKGVPCIILFKSGKEIGRIIGVESEDLLIDKISSHLGDID